MRRPDRLGKVARSRRRPCGPDGGIIELAVVVGEVGIERRVVGRAHEVAVVALQAVHDGGAAGREWPAKRAVAKRIAGGPQELVARAAAGLADVS